MQRRAEAPSVAEQSIQEFQNKKTGNFLDSKFWFKVQV